ncbi:purple acid phosphatase family protein [Georgenia yuyongxinii]|uniref:Metallophosphoesterase family protein n=1 Tax=Georgenia yuyongxinii TaxID=2589797 RepID=A0A552WNZ0_9MICO|nr:metallophosphoesterase family protein [Georgenia yuyongxinii]TRW44505.1 metallophosphoesterase family protein [Georgenia yuyongxinii]
MTNYSEHVHGSDQLHLAWVGDTATTLTVIWRSCDPAADAVVHYRLPGEERWREASGRHRLVDELGALQEVTLTGLDPQTRYEYRVGCGPEQQGRVRAFRTAPQTGEVADMEIVFVSDTGLIGRVDGLTDGTEQIIEDITKRDPLLVLHGGDFAYFDTDRRFQFLEESIDYFFNQMVPVASQAPMMPTWGNHELMYVLQERIEPWLDRFATPEGSEGRLNYSYDVGHVHFVSICAFEFDDPLPEERLRWVIEDIRAAQAAGQRWIVPVLHVAPFAEGRNHPSNLALRAQLGPVFEELGIRLVVTSHDQAYERTYPLIDVPARNAPTSTSLVEYGPGDGTVWMKVSPGGKRSNINKNFSNFATEEPPHWTAVRNNTIHNYAVLRFTGDGALVVEVQGVRGDGSTPVVIDRFTLLASQEPVFAHDAVGAGLTAEGGAS